MRKRLRFRAAAPAAFVLLAACGTTPPDDQTLAANAAAYFTGDFACTRGDAARVPFAALDANPATYDGRCVAFDAFSDGTRLYAGATEMQMDRRSAATHSRLGVTWKASDLARHLQLGPSFVTIVGRVRDCAGHRARWQAARDLEARVGHAVAPPAEGCTGLATVYASEATIVPTAMD
ncbi:MAG TPA: hypothetical protein VMH86_13820 [Rhizomicrobium sp.]|nr:hypothetical protein [Rhizomicrobium sp.]